MRVDPKKIVKELVARVGKPEARRLMIAAGVGIDTAIRLSNEKYQSEVGALVGAAIVRANEASKQKAS